MRALHVTLLVACLVISSVAHADGGKKTVGAIIGAIIGGFIGAAVADNPGNSRNGCGYSPSYRSGSYGYRPYPAYYPQPQYAPQYYPVPAPCQGYGYGLAQVTEYREGHHVVSQPFAPGTLLTVLEPGTGRDVGTLVVDASNGLTSWCHPIRNGANVGNYVVPAPPAAGY